MGKINLLDISVANLIAAGEVVDRPASAVKELLENSLDAGATKLTVEIKNGGVSLIRVTDNGCGMSREDACLSVRRHATSKIRRAEDLDGIATLGFRGEALAAISSVSDFSIMTKRAGDPTGTYVKCRNGEVIGCEEAGCPDGTTVSAEDLFSNVPARRKFLRRDVTETAAVTAVVEKIALSRPDVGIKYITDNVLRFSTPGDGKLISAIYVTLGRDFASKLIPVDDLTDGIAVKGYIGTPENCRASRSGENFFINGRYVRCQTAAAALEQAFSSYIPKEKFPCAILNITFSPAFVDVNVHPQKLEVKFSNEKPVFNSVFCAVRNALTDKIPRPTDDGLRYTGDSRKLFNEIITAKASSPEEAMKIAADRDRLTSKYEQLVIPREEPRTEEAPPMPPVITAAPAE
ncbi:MAG: DNA mismatch repair endonuclease MutL, partial [Clostridia bacterium]|nr:DNA mismatch repair endonuclease MutL [Clostridia bacterium]